MNMPVLEKLDGELVTLSLLNTLHPCEIPKYIEPIYQLRADPDVSKFLRTTYISLEKVGRWLRHLPTLIETDRSFAIYKDEDLIGSCGLHDIDTANLHAVLGIYIGKPALHSQGLGTDAVRTLCDHGFTNIGLRKINLWVLGSNTRAIRCYEKCGSQEVGRQKDHFIRDDILHDYVLMELFASG